ncbi:MAG TPA: SCO family protein [Bryobacterales bacterium]|nr:SCO family protein [Bryobacterales bacterium]
MRLGPFFTSLGWGEKAMVSVATLALSVAGCSKTSTEEARANSQGDPPALEYAPPEPGSYALPPIQPASDGAVIDESGQRRRLFDYLGDRYVLLSFIYTRCAVVKGCPLATSVFQRLRNRLDEEPTMGGSVRLVTLSFDPERDTPATMQLYARHAGVKSHGKAETWTFLTTLSLGDLEPILDSYGQYVTREIDAGGRFTGNRSHVLKVFLIDRERRVRQIYSSDSLHPSLVINDVKTLMMETATK